MWQAGWPKKTPDPLASIDQLTASDLATRPASSTRNGTVPGLSRSQTAPSGRRTAPAVDGAILTVLWNVFPATLTRMGPASSAPVGLSISSVSVFSARSIDGEATAGPPLPSGGT